MTNANNTANYKERMRAKGMVRTPEIWAYPEYKSGLWLLRMAIKEDDLDALQRALSSIYLAFQSHTGSKLPDARIPGRL